MSSNEFITNGGDEVNTLWTSRRFRICQILERFLEDNVYVIGLQENDHPFFILNELQKHKPELRCIHLLAGDAERSADKLRLLAIRDYLNENESSFRNDTSNLKKSLEDFDNLYRRINSWYKNNQLDQIKKKFTMTSFREEHSDILQQFLKRSPNDLYVVNDGNSIYYDSKVLEYVEPILGPHMNKTEFSNLFTGHDIACRFRIRNDNGNFLTVVCSHLKSGEGSENEKKRVNQISNILKIANQNSEASVILVDSNTSNLYKTDMEKSGTNDVLFVDDVLHQAGFKDIIPVKGNECFKMRHAKGSQPNKFGNFMFDTIDRIIVKPELCDNFRFVQTVWLRTLSNEYYNNVLSWRIEDDKRRKLKNLCRDKIWEDDMNKNDTGDSEFDKNILLQLYPNDSIPSDHPPLVAEINFKL